MSRNIHQPASRELDVANLRKQVEATERMVRTASGLWIPKPPTGTPNGSVATSDTTQTGLVRWENRNVVTALPGSPVDGQECYFQTAAMAAAGISPWHLKFDNDWTLDTNKWQVVGAVRSANTVAPQESTASTSYTDLATAGPSFACPLSGVYDYEIHSNIAHNTINAVAYVTLGTAANVAIGNDWYWQAYAANANGQIHGGERVNMTAATTYELLYKTNAGTGFFNTRILKVTPIRVR